MTSARARKASALAALSIVVMLGYSKRAAAEDGGPTIALIAEPRAGETGRLRAGAPLRIGFRISNRAGDFPLGDLHPGAWIRRATEGRNDCEEAVRGYLRRGVNAGADIDLNGYAFATLNADQTLAVLDPRLDLATSNLLSLTRLEHEVGDWQLAPETGRLFLTLPARDELVSVDLFSGRIAERWPMATTPVELAAVAGLNPFWVAAEGAGSLLQLDPETGEVSNTLDLSVGRIRLVVDQDDQRLFALGASGKLLIVDARTGGLMSSHRIDGEVTGLVYSPKADALLIGHQDETLTVLYLDRPEKPLTLRMPAPADQLKIDHDGRWLFALDREGGRLSIVDLAQNRATHVLEFQGKPDRMAMSDDYLYLRETEAARVSILHLATLDADSMPGVLDVAIGANPAGATDLTSTLPTIAPLPEGGGALIAHPIDKTLYLYMETGMQAPMNAFRSWTAAPKAVLIHDRSLNETDPGVYETTTLISDPGAYEIVFHLPNPGHVACFPIDVERGESVMASSPEHRRSPTVTTRIDGPADHGQPVAVTLELLDPSNDDPIDGINDLRVLVVDHDGRWHWQGFARPLGDRGGYSIELTPPEPGSYSLFASAPSVGLTFESQPRLQLLLE